MQKGHKRANIVPSFSISLQAGLLCLKSFSLVAKALVPSLLEVNLQIVLGFAEAGDTLNGI